MGSMDFSALGDFFGAFGDIFGGIGTLSSFSAE
jgi:hypothetical protein